MSPANMILMCGDPSEILMLYGTGDVDPEILYFSLLPYILGNPWYVEPSYPL